MAACGCYKNEFSLVVSVEINLLTNILRSGFGIEWEKKWRGGYRWLRDDDVDTMNGNYWGIPVLLLTRVSAPSTVPVSPHKTTKVAECYQDCGVIRVRSCIDNLDMNIELSMVRVPQTEDFPNNGKQMLLWQDTHIISLWQLWYYQCRQLLCNFGYWIVSDSSFLPGGSPNNGRCDSAKTHIC